MAKTVDRTDITKETFEEAYVRYGADVSLWPDQMRSGAKAYLETAEGKQLFADMKGLDQMFDRVAETYSSEAPDAAFMARLARIPLEHEQAGSRLPNWIKKTLLPVFDGLAPRFVMQQAAVFIVVLGIGIAAGANGFGVVPVEQEQVDISDGWFAHTLDVEASDDVLED